MSKEEHYEERKRLYNQFKTDCPQTIGETDKAFDNDNFIDWLVDNQNTNPLIEEIAELKKQVEYQKSGYITLKEYLKTDDILGSIMKLKSELKASKSEANEALQKSHDELLKIAKHYIKNHDYWVIANADKLTLNNK